MTLRVTFCHFSRHPYFRFLEMKNLMLLAVLPVTFSISYRPIRERFRIHKIVNFNF